jgi:hypothetical protein
MKNKSVIFAAYMPSTDIIFLYGSSYFYGYSDAVLSQDIRLPIHNGLLLTRCNLYLAVCGKVAFPLLNILIFHYMPSTVKDYSAAKNSNCHVTPDCESVKNYLNLLPKSEQNSQGLENVDSSIAISSDANGSKISSEKIGHSTTGENSYVDGEIFHQTNHVDKNTGITGISGTGHTITVNQCPDELIQLLVKLIKTLQQ